MKVRRGRRTNRFSRCFYDVWLCFSFWGLSIKYAGVSWVRFDVTTSIATSFCLVVATYIIFKALCANALLKNKVDPSVKTGRGAVLRATLLLLPSVVERDG